MAQFSYTAEKAGGETYRGVAQASDRFELYQIVRQEGGKIVSLEEEGKNSWASIAKWNAIFARVSEYEKILFARNLGSMLGAGLTLARALAVMVRQTKNVKMLEMLESLESDVRRGATLNQALAKFPRIFPKLFVAMVRAGEEGGDLPASLGVVADQMERMYNLKKKIRGALIYPCIILIAIFGVGVVMMIEVVPSLAATFAQMNVPLPPTTQVIIGISNFLVQNTLLSLAIIAGIVACLTLIARSKRGKRVFEFAFMRTPVIGGIVKEVNAARTSRTLSSLLSSGVDVITSLQITGEVVQNTFFQAVIADASRAVGSGEPLSSAFARREDLYPAFVGEMMAVGEETGALAEMLKRLALFYEDEVDRKTKDMSTIIEPFLMIVIGIAVGFFAVSMITPIYSLSSAIN